MRVLLKFAIVCFFSILAFAPWTLAQAQVRTIYLVRHADKVSDDTDAPLSEAGHRRAECLAGMLADAHIQKIYVSDLQRTQQTAAPLAEKLQLKPLVVPLSKVDDLIHALRSEKADNMLVVWHDATLPKILLALGAPKITPIAHTEYDRFFILTFARVGKNSSPRLTALRYCDDPK